MLLLLYYYNYTTTPVTNTTLYTLPLLQRRHNVRTNLDYLCQELHSIMVQGKVYLLPVLSSTDHDAGTHSIQTGILHYLPLPPVDPIQILESVRSVKPFYITDPIVRLAYKLSVPSAVASFAVKLSELQGIKDNYIHTSFREVIKPDISAVYSYWYKLLHVVAVAMTQQPVSEDSYCYSRSSDSSRNSSSRNNSSSTSSSTGSTNCSTSQEHTNKATTTATTTTVPTWRQLRRAGICSLEDHPADELAVLPRQVVRVQYHILEYLALSLPHSMDDLCITGIRSALLDIVQLTTTGTSNTTTTGTTTTTAAGTNTSKVDGSKYQEYIQFSVAYKALMDNCKMFLGLVSLPTPLLTAYHSGSSNSCNSSSIYNDISSSSGSSMPYHPSSTPYVNLNYANYITIVHELYGDSISNINAAAELVISYRQEEKRLMSKQEFVDVVKSVYPSVEFSNMVV